MESEQQPKSSNSNLGLIIGLVIASLAVVAAIVILVLTIRPEPLVTTTFSQYPQCDVPEDLPQEGTSVEISPVYESALRVAGVTLQPSSGQQNGWAFPLRPNQFDLLSPSYLKWRVNIIPGTCVQPDDSIKYVFYNLGLLTNMTTIIEGFAPPVQGLRTETPNFNSTNQQWHIKHLGRTNPMFQGQYVIYNSSIQRALQLAYNTTNPDQPFPYLTLAPYNWDQQVFQRFRLNPTSLSGGPCGTDDNLDHVGNLDNIPCIENSQG